MLPVLTQIGPVEVRSYALAVFLAFVVGGVIRRREVRRLGYQTDPSHGWVSLGGLLGAIVGAKLGLLLFEPWTDLAQVLRSLFRLDFTGKTVLGGITGGYLGVEGMKKAVGINYSTGDGFAVALPVGQAIGRLGCFLNGCCFGTETESALSVQMHNAMRHPVQLYEAGLDLVLAGLLISWRFKGWPAGNLFRRYLIGYALIRFVLDPLRGDARLAVGPLSALQWYCLVWALIFSVLVVRSERVPHGR